MKKDVTGIAGAARIYQLTAKDLQKQEQHGKRLDLTGQGRAVYNAPPVTTTGLDLQTLFDAHVSGAFVPQANSKAMHVLIQFPTALVDGEDAEFMLQHARRFCERVFGDQAIFADRVDRDEKGRHNVDVFVAPKYTKKTKHQTKTAVAMSRHLKLLAAEYKQPPSPRGTATALQDALFEYFRDEMGLEGVERGNAKTLPGSDWRTSEQLRESELDNREIALEAGLGEVARIKSELEATCEQQSMLNRKAAAELDAAERERQETLNANAVANENRNAAEKSRAEAEADRQDAARQVERARQDQIAAAAERDAALSKREAVDRLLADTLDNSTLSRQASERKQAALDQQQAKISEALNGAMNDRALAKSEAESSRRLREKLEVDHASVVAEREALAESHRSLGEEKSIHLRQITLLLRATNDEAGLELRPTDAAFRMTTSKMTEDEQEAYKKTWAKPLFEMARRLAETLDRLRSLVLRLTKREQDVEDREVDVAAKEASYADRVAKHERELETHRAAVVALEGRERNIRALEDRANKAIEKSVEAVQHAEQSERGARDALTRHEEWFEVVEALRTMPGDVSIVGGLINISETAFEKIPEEVIDLIHGIPPHWVQKIVTERHLMFKAQQQLNDKERGALNLEKELRLLLHEKKLSLSLEQERSLAVARIHFKQIEASGH